MQPPVEIKKPNKLLKWSLIVVAIFLGIFIILAGTSFAISYKYENKIYPGIRINDLKLGGLTKTQANNVINGKFKQTYGDGFFFNFEDNLKTINNDNEQILKLNLESLVEKTFVEGRESNLWKKQTRIIKNAIFKKKYSLDYQLDKELLRNQMETQFSIHENPAKNAIIELKDIDRKTKEYTLSFSQSETGETFNFNSAIDEMSVAIENFQNPQIKLTRSIDQPTITGADAKAQEQKVKELLEIDGLSLTYEGERWDIDWSDYARWIKLGLNDEENITVLLDPVMVSGQIQAISQEINQAPVNAKLQIKNNRVTDFQASQNGQKINEEKTFQLINDEIVSNGNNEIELIVEVTEPEIKVENTNDLGIKELLGRGWSDFSGSPSNRRHNIGIGAASLHGVLIAPGDEFSLIKTLGEINGQSGYKPELVIKKGETIPEYGGGLCQVGTTIFRAALQSALKISARRNHSYRVGYYEPAGTDATIYDPWPDFKFINDTEKYILIQTNLWGDNLSFEIWGTGDGRTVSFEGNNTVDNIINLKPTIFNIVKPGPAKEIETTELAPGEKKRTEYAHNGADAIFYQYITMPGEEPEKITYSSHYVPWQEVFLVGVDPKKKEAEAAAELAKKEAEEKEATEQEETTTE